MIRSIIIDDEPKAQKNLFNLLKEYTPSVDVMAMESTLTEGLKSIEKFEPDVVFLDIEMQNESGFDLFDKVEEPDFEVVFVTAHDEYAVRAFKYAASDYLLKPIDINDLVETVDRLEKRQDKSQRKDQISLLVDNLKNNTNRFDKIVLPTLESMIFVETDSIVRCESLDNYTNFHLQSGKVLLVSKNIKYYEDLLSDRNFFRVHRSHLINLNYIKEYFRGEGGYITMTDGSSVPVARRKKVAFLDRIHAH